MIREGLRHGFSESVWNAAKIEARSIMIERAKLRELISYSDLVEQVRSISFAPNDMRLFHMLGEISSEEDTAGRGMLTAVVVHKTDQKPGKGFFELAKRLGRDTRDETGCWVAELHKVHAVWSEGAKRP
jgi:hypothetical protein